MKKKILFGATLLTTMALAACGTGSSESSETADSAAEKSPSGETLAENQKIGVTINGELASLDNALASDTPSLTVIHDLNEGLYRVGDDGKLELGLAAEEPAVSDDGLVYTYKIKENADWSNGDPVTAEDFVYTYRKFVDPETASPNGNKFYALKNAKVIQNGEMDANQLGVKAINEKTVEFTLESPVAYFKDLLGTDIYLPQNHSVAEKLGTKYGTNSENFVANGPFTITGWEGTNLDWTMMPNDEYWDAENVFLDQVNWHVSKESSTNANLFENGDIQYTTITNPYVEQYTGSEELTISPTALVGYLSFNNERETTANIHLRQAMGRSFDKKSFVEKILKDGSEPVNGFVPSGYASDPETGEDYREENGDFLTYDVAEAQKEWEKAKADLGVDTLDIELLTSDTDTSKQISEFLQAEWEKNLEGLNITIRNIPLNNRLETTNAGEYDVVFGTFIPSYSDPIAFLEMYESEGGLNRSGYSNETYDKLSLDTKETYANDSAKRWQALLEMEKILIQEDAQVAPIYQGSNAALKDPKLKGVQVLPAGSSMYLRTAYLTAE